MLYIFILHFKVCKRFTINCESLRYGKTDVLQICSRQKIIFKNLSLKIAFLNSHTNVCSKLSLKHRLEEVVAGVLKFGGLLEVDHEQGESHFDCEQPPDHLRCHLTYSIDHVVHSYCISVPACEISLKQVNCKSLDHQNIIQNSCV